MTKILVECDKCGKKFPPHLLDGKPGPGDWTAEALADAADRGESFDRIECETCYGPNFIPGAPE